ncbi:MAG: TetR/AcrR family transcriptional regulator [Acidimicrobiales bacterium]
MTSGVRAQRRAEIEAQLLDAGRRHLAQHGAAAISIRAIARDIGMAPSALFRYIDNRDDLLTLLIVDGYDSLADRVDTAVADAEPGDPAARWRALAGATRAWALEHPHQWALLYGSPVPEYHAPGDRTTAAGTRVTDLLVDIGADAVEAGLATAAATPDADLASAAARAVARGLTLVTGRAGDPVGGLPSGTLANGVTAWLLLVGAVSAEVFEQLGDGVDYAPVFAYAVEVGRTLMFAN